MIKRKAITTLIATPLSVLVVLVLFFGGWDDFPNLVFLTGLFSLGAFSHILVYGVLVTFLSDFFTKRFQGKLRMVLSFATHLALGGLFGFLFPIFDFRLFGDSINSGIVLAVITAICFWATDEMLRRTNSNRIRTEISL